VKITAQEIWKELENARNFKTQNKIYDTAKQNEMMVKGEQWHGVNLKNLAPTTYNFIGQVEKTHISSVMSQEISITRSADATSQNNETVQRAAKIFTQLDKDNWERVKMDQLNEDVLEDAFVSALGGTFWWWDEDIMTGNDFITKGDFKADYVDAVNLHVANPNDLCIQSQDWTMLTIRKTVNQARALFKARGVSVDELEMIQSDESTVYEAYDKAQVEQDSAYKSDQVTIALKLYKENKKVMCIYSTANVCTKSIDTELTQYPIAIMNWEKRKSFIYGVSPVTSVVANQKVANMQSAIRHLSAQLMSIPKMGFNKNMVTGVTNAVGGIYEINAQPGADISNALHYWQPTTTTFDADKSIDQSIDRTKSLMGANQALLGESNPDNFRAIMAQQKQAGIPLESVKRRFNQYVEDVALIWLDFYQHKYKLTRAAVIGEGEEQEILQFKGTDFADIYLNTKIDVGASTQLNEIVQMEMADNFWDKGLIKDPVLYFEMYPDFNGKQKIIESYKEMQQQQEEMAQQPDMNDMVSQLPPEMQQQFMALPPEQQQAYIQEFMAGAV
jgi:hypothetical protein